jgi:hypothetical protein
MKVFLRILGNILTNGLLTSIFWTISGYIYTVISPPKGFWGQGGLLAIYVSFVVSLIIGGINGLLIGIFKTSPILSAVIGGILFVLIAITELLQGKNTTSEGLIIYLIAAILAALACFLTALIFNKFRLNPIK